MLAACLVTLYIPQTLSERRKSLHFLLSLFQHSRRQLNYKFVSSFPLLTVQEEIPQILRCTSFPLQCKPSLETFACFPPSQKLSTVFGHLGTNLKLNHIRHLPLTISWFPPIWKLTLTPGCTWNITTCSCGCGSCVGQYGRDGGSNPAPK